MAAGQARPVPEASSVDQDAPYIEACAREGLNESECVGRLIWYKATGGNDRFHTYTFQQRIGVLVDWYRVLRSDQRDDRFCGLGHHQRSGLLQARRAGLSRPRVRGRDLRLRLVSGRRRAAEVRRQAGVCRSGLRAEGRARSTPGDPHTKGGKLDQRHSACDLKFGTSTGALGLRKFPNPRFDAGKVEAAERRHHRQLGRLPPSR